MEGSRSHGRAHFASREQESERFAAAQRLGALIERRDLLVTRVGEIEAQMTCEERIIRSFDG
jgi:hypothetical protein